MLVWNSINIIYIIAGGIASLIAIVAVIVKAIQRPPFTGKEILQIVSVTAIIVLLIGTASVALAYFTFNHSQTNEGTPTANRTVTPAPDARPGSPTVTPPCENACIIYAQKLYQQVTSKRSTWSDPLSSQDSNKWDVYTTTDKAEQCSFIGGAYHAFAQKDGAVGECFAHAPVFRSSNFAFRVQMNVVNGDSGGIIFRAQFPDFNALMYRFHVTILNNGSYDVYLSENNNNQGHNFSCYGQKGYYCENSAILPGIHETNTLAVIAQGSKMYFYVNDQVIFQVTDGTSSSGYIGVYANDKPDSTEVKFNNAQIWEF